MQFRILVLAHLLFALGASTSPPSLNQPGFDALAANLGVRYEIVDNRPPAHPPGADGTFLTTLSFTMPATLPQGLGSDHFAIYFSFVNRLPLVESDVFQHTWINGDLNRLTLKPGAVLEPGKTYTVRLWGAGAHHSVAFVMPNLYLSADGVEARVIAATRPVIDRETGLETLPFVAPMTDEAKLAASGADDRTVWQTPERAFDSFAERGPATAPGWAILRTPPPAKLRPANPLPLRHGVALMLEGVKRAQLGVALDGLGVPLTGRIPLEIQVDPGAWMTAEG